MTASRCGEVASMARASTPSTQDRRKDADKHVIQRVRQADVVVELHIYLC